MNTVIKVSLGNCVPVIEKVWVVVEEGVSYVMIQYRQHAQAVVIVPPQAEKAII